MSHNKPENTSEESKEIKENESTNKEFDLDDDNHQHIIRSEN